MKNQIRIIGGQWRGRKVNFVPTQGLRPTSDRIKETLFNWLAPVVVNARCLELFAGSAALSFEALSRHAAYALAIENNREAFSCILKNKQRLDAEKLDVVEQDVFVWLQETSPTERFDIVFIDPPYALNFLPQVIAALSKKAWLNKGALIYFESNQVVLSSQLPNDWEILKSNQAGQVFYYLAQKS